MLAIKASNHLICVREKCGNFDVTHIFCIQGISLEANTLLHKHKERHLCIISSIIFSCNVKLYVKLIIEILYFTIRADLFAFIINSTH
jgi:hypothetical protein